jgi:hypothetical protein
MVDKLFQPKRAQEDLAQARRDAWEAHEAKKRELLRNKRVKTIYRIKKRHHDVLATRIQHAYREYKLRQIARLPTPSKARRAASIAEVRR